MTAITATKARENIYQLIQEVNASCTPVTIINTRGKRQFLFHCFSHEQKSKKS